MSRVNEHTGGYKRVISIERYTDRSDRYCVTSEKLSRNWESVRKRPCALANLGLFALTFPPLLSLFAAAAFLSPPSKTTSTAKHDIKIKQRHKSRYLITKQRINEHFYTSGQVDKIDIVEFTVECFTWELWIRHVHWFFLEWWHPTSLPLMTQVGDDWLWLLETCCVEKHAHIYHWQSSFTMYRLNRSSFFARRAFSTHRYPVKPNLEAIVRVGLGLSGLSGSGLQTISIKRILMRMLIRVVQSRCIQRYIERTYIYTCFFLWERQSSVNSMSVCFMVCLIECTIFALW